MESSFDPTTDKRTFLERVAESQNLVFFGVFIILIPLMMHTANLLLSVSIIQSNWYAYFFAIGFDLAIFIFAAHGRLTAAGGIAFVVFLLNASVLNLDTLNYKFDPMIVKLMVTIVLSGTSAWILHSYVIMFNDKKAERNKVMSLHQNVYQKEKEIDLLTNKLKSHEQNIADMEERLKEYETTRLAEEISKAKRGAEVAELVSADYVKVGSNIICTHCQNSFDSVGKYEMFKTKFCTRKECKVVVSQEQQVAV